MAKKKGGAGAGAQPKKMDKSAMKKRDKVAEDKTFGLKNKNKSKKVQKYVATVKSQGMDKNTMAYQKQKEAAKAAKAAAAAQQREMANMFKTVQAKPKAGCDPKSVICAYFKQGLCKRGDKCKFSHNYQQVRKVAKLDMYTDPRWVDKEDTRANKTDIICKFFLEACEKKQYGALWVCPNDGKNCAYNHCLPEGYILDRDKKIEKANADDEVSLEEQIEIDRKELLKRTDLTPVTKESFEKWQLEQEDKRKLAVQNKVKQMEKKATVRLGQAASGLSGRELFTYDPSLFIDDADAADDIEIQSESDEDEEKKEDAKIEQVITAVGDASLFLDDDDDVHISDDD